MHIKLSNFLGIQHYCLYHNHLLLEVLIQVVRYKKHADKKREADVKQRLRNSKEDRQTKFQIIAYKNCFY